ncbi:signal peptidase II [Staphylococcus aureus]|uniref:signal peptidase II n=1 Tax=Staphylococcus aureus TaxID=1280 RepID=UPI000A115D2E|nr:signal peptidase II [Staphylococcus aureus]
MHKKYFIGTSILIAVFVVIFDQVTKYIIATTMKIGDSFEVIPHFLNITSHRNNGAAWGILSGKMTFFFIITIIILIALVYFFIKDAQYNLFMQVAISLLFAGALGNFIDTNIFGYDFPIFNIADSSLTIGVILIIIALLKDTSNKKEKEVK